MSRRCSRRGRATGSRPAWPMARSARPLVRELDEPGPRPRFRALRRPSGRAARPRPPAPRARLPQAHPGSADPQGAHQPRPFGNPPDGHRARREVLHESSIFKDRDFRRPLIEGAEQAGNPRLPKVFRALEPQTLPRGPRRTVGEAGSTHILASLRRMRALGRSTPEAAALRPPADSRRRKRARLDRGRTSALWRRRASIARSLGARILKTETAAAAASALALAGLGLI